jgi:coenzyme F420 hydrogenase subunit beta
MKINDVEDIVRWRLCIGCGACAFICPNHVIGLENRLDDGIRPKIVNKEMCAGCDQCVRVCPGYSYLPNYKYKKEANYNELEYIFGPVYSIWEGHAADKDIRFKGSSGGVITALSLYGIEQEGMIGAIHIDQCDQKAWNNRVVLSKNKDDLLERTGSRYSPAAPCSRIGDFNIQKEKCVFIGKPCDVSGLRNIISIKPKLKERFGLILGIFCAGTPSTRGTLNLLKLLNLDLEKIEKIRYRGEGWPGSFSTKDKDEKAINKRIPYNRAWDYLEKYRPYRCYLCPDGTSELADISCGDPWYRNDLESENGDSLIIVRTERGQRIIEGAIRKGYVVLEETIPRNVINSQKNLTAKRMSIWGRLIALKIFLIPVPNYTSFPLLDNWLKLKTRDKLRSFLGTIKRIVVRKYYLPKNDCT